jgi:PAS domain-containing protein
MTPSTYRPDASSGAHPPDASSGAHPPDSRHHDPVDLDERIRDLNQRIERLSQYMDEADIGNGEDDTITVSDYAKLANIHGQLTSRLGRLLRDQQQLQGSGSAELEQAIGDALDLAGEVLGVDL